MSSHNQGGGGHGGGGGSSERWLLTYADMITLLMVLFIVLYAMSVVDKAKYESIAVSLHQAMGGGSVIPAPFPGVGPGLGTGTSDPTAPPISPPATPEQLESIGKELAADFSQDGRFTVFVGERGLTVSLAGSAAFDSGDDAIKSEFRPLLDAIATKLAALGNDISVEGFADSDPIRSGKFPSNWYLSTARANQVRDYLQSKGVAAERLIVVGYGDARPVYSNDTPEGKAKNRRVDVVILKEKQQVDLGQQIAPGN